MKKEKNYTDNIRASMTNSMSACKRGLLSPFDFMKPNIEEAMLSCFFGEMKIEILSSVVGEGRRCGRRKKLLRVEVTIY